MIIRHTLVFIFIIASLLDACGQDKTKSVVDKVLLDLQTIAFIEIRNHSGHKDTIPETRQRLTAEQSRIFVDKWNKAKSKGPYKFISLYFVEVTIKDGSKRNFRLNGSIIKEKNDWGFDLGDEKYIERLWTETK